MTTCGLRGGVGEREGGRAVLAEHWRLGAEGRMIGGPETAPNRRAHLRELRGHGGDVVQPEAAVREEGPEAGLVGPRRLGGVRGRLAAAAGAAPLLLLQ
jgi:hypothetical protein